LTLRRTVFYGGKQAVSSPNAAATIPAENWKKDLIMCLVLVLSAGWVFGSL